MSALWTDALGIPDALARTLDTADGLVETAELIAGTERRLVVTGNGAAYHAALAFWIAALDAASAPFDVVAIPAGLIATGSFRWRAGDRLLAVSASGELRDLLDALDTGAPRPFGLVTSTPGSSLARLADARAVVHVTRQVGATHTQAYCGNVLVLLALWARVTRERSFADAVRAAPDAVARALSETDAWLEGMRPSLRVPRAAVAFGSGPGWAAALEAALLLKEVARIPAEGAETREGATSAMFGLGPDDLAVRVTRDRLAEEAEELCRSAGATVLPLADTHATHPALLAITSFPSALALAIALAELGGHDVEAPSWLDLYERTARRLR